MFLMFIFLSRFILSSNLITDSDKLYEKKYKNIGRVGYSFEYLGQVPRSKKPELKSENILPPERIPVYDKNPKLTPDEQDLILEESKYITVNTTRKLSGTYDIFDADGYLYLKGEKLQYSNGTFRKLYKHLGAVGNFLGDVSDDEPAIKKKLTYRVRNNVFSITGLFAPAGEIISIRISETDLNRINKLHVSIGPLLNNGDANNIWKGREFVRMPLIGNLFILHKDLSPITRDGDDYIFYIGSFLGGPIYVKPETFTHCDLTITISGAVRYAHYVLGYTTREEFEENKKSSAPYFDLEIWQNGQMHSGPRSVITTIDYDKLYDAAIYWQKVTSVSNQVPESAPAKTSVNMMYEPFIAAGGAVAFGGRGTTNCPLYWFEYSTNYKKCLQDSSCDTWGPHHEYHHHFQRNYGLTRNGTFNADTETTNNVVTLISYSYFTKVSQRRTEDSEPTGDTWNLYTSASWVVKDAITAFHNDHHLIFYAVFLHCFGQEMMLKVMNIENGPSNELWYSTWTNLTELDFTYFFREIYQTDRLPLLQSEVDKYKDKHYKNFIPIACRYQTGVGYKIKGKYNKIRTMYPFLIKNGEIKVLDFAKQMVVPNGFTFTIKSVSNPVYGTLKKQSENVYVYTPDENSLTSGEITFTIGLKKDDDPNFEVDDIEMYTELQQTKSIVEKDAKGRDVLTRTIYTFPYVPDDPIAEYESRFANATSEVTILNNATKNGLNTQIMVTQEQNPQNRISVLQGKFEVEAGKYRIALMCRNLGVLYLSYDNGKTYELGCQVLFECADERYYTENESIFVHKEFEHEQWVYFKFVVCHKMQILQRRLFSKIGLDKYAEDGTISSNVKDLEDARSINYEPDPVFYSKDFYPSVWSQSRKTQFEIKGTLLKYNYEKYPDPKFNITNLFDDDDTNIVHTNNRFVKDTNPFMIFVDLGKEIQANTMVIYGATEGQWQYQPTQFKLYAGTDKDDLHLIYEVDAATVKNHNVVCNFETQIFRYYQLNITNGAQGGDNRFVVFRCVKFSNTYKGTIVSLDDDRVTLFNNWKKKASSAISTFGSFYETDENKAKLLFRFNGTGFGINAQKSTEYGKFDVYVDNRLMDIIDLNKEPQPKGLCVCTIKNLENKEHEVVLIGAKYNIESFIILQDDLAQTSEEIDADIPPTPRPEPPETPSQSIVPTEIPVQPPTEEPVQPPTEEPVQPPTENPVQPPPVQPPTEKPVQPPTEIPVQPPTENPVQPPTEKPVQPPTENPIQPPTENPVQPPTEKPVQPPSENPVQPPTEKPVQPPSENPVQPEITDVPTNIIEIKPDQNGVIDTTQIDDDKSQNEYESVVTTEKVQIIGNGNKNLFISITIDAVVEFDKTDAKFGIKLDSQNNEASIKLNQESAEMNVKGDGKLTIDAGKDVKKLSISNISVSHKETLEINAKEHLESLEFENLNMFGDSIFNANLLGQTRKTANVKKVTINNRANSQLSNLGITGKVDIGLNAAVSLSKVDLSKVEEMKITFSRSSQERTPITGKIGEHPASIKLFESDASKAALLNDEKFIIASALKDDFPDCEQWRGVVKLDGTNFKDVKCRDQNENLELVALSESEPGESNESKKNSMPIIIGVVAAVVVVLVIVVVVIVVVKRKKRLIKSSDSNILETNNFDDDI